MSNWTDVTHSSKAGVIGVGSMGQHHARVYRELPAASLVGVYDIDRNRGRGIADEYGTEFVADRSELLEMVDVVSVAVPTVHHVETVQACIDHGVDVLVEKPFVDDVEAGRRLAAQAKERGITLQVGHIERFNPALQVAADIATELDIVAVDIDRLGPPLDRDNEDTVVMDLMIHDVDILLSLVDSDIETLSAVARSDQHVSAQFGFENGSIATVTSSRLTQEKVRTLSITADSCRVNVDFISQSVEIHRRSLPEYVQANGDIRYRHESVIERPMVQNGEPLKSELAAFIDAARNGTRPLVTAEDALEVLQVIQQIENAAFHPEAEVVQS